MNSRVQPSADTNDRSRGGRATSGALEARYRFVLWLTPAVERFSLSQKVVLGDRIQSTALDVLERLIEATYICSARLAAANLGLKNLRVLGHLARNLRFLDTRRYQSAARSIDDTARPAWMPREI